MPKSPEPQLLDKALQRSGIDRAKVYVTNVVKHFKRVLVGKRRIHSKPDAPEIAACRPWLEAEIAVCEAEGDRLLVSHRRPGAAGEGFSGYPPKGRMGPVAPGALRACHRASVIHPPRARRRGARGGDGGPGRRSAQGSQLLDESGW